MAYSERLNKVYFINYFCNMCVLFKVNVFIYWSNWCLKNVKTFMLCKDNLSKVFNWKWNFKRQMLDRVQSKNHHFCQFNRECKTLKLGHDSLARHLLATSKMSDQRREWALNIILDPSADFKFNRIDLFCSITQF